MIVDIQDILALYDQQQRIDIEYPGMRKNVSPHIVRFVQPAPGMSHIQYSCLDEANVEAVIQDQISYFTQIGQPFSWKVYDHDTPADLRDRLAAHGFQPDELEGVRRLDILSSAQPVCRSMGGSTVAEYRRRGLYTAVLAIRVREAWRRGYRFLTVDTSPMSRPIVRQHGFRLLTHAQDFDWTANDQLLATRATAPDGAIRS